MRISDWSSDVCSSDLEHNVSQMQLRRKPFCWRCTSTALSNRRTRRPSNGKRIQYRKIGDCVSELVIGFVKPSPGWAILRIRRKPSSLHLAVGRAQFCVSDQGARMELGNGARGIFSSFRRIILAVSLAVASALTMPQTGHAQTCIISERPVLDSSGVEANACAVTILAEDASIGDHHFAEMWKGKPRFTARVIDGDIVVHREIGRAHV